MRLLVTTFLLASFVLGLMYHFVTRQPMPWWPDSAIIGSSAGLLVALTIWKAVNIDWPFDLALFRFARAAMRAVKHHI